MVGGVCRDHMHGKNNKADYYWGTFGGGRVGERMKFVLYLYI